MTQLMGESAIVDHVDVIEITDETFQDKSRDASSIA